MNKRRTIDGTDRQGNDSAFKSTNCTFIYTVKDKSSLILLTVQALNFSFKHILQSCL